MAGRSPRLPAASLILLLSLGGCSSYGDWGPQRGSKEFTEASELWERPLGAALLLPVGALESTLSLAATIGVNMLLGPITSLAVHAGYNPPCVWLFPGTRIALTLLNPDRNLDLFQPAPAQVWGIKGYERPGDERNRKTP